MSGHTPGPWTTRILTGTCSTRVYGDRRIVCELPFRQGEPNAANASLIAAAPELLEMLERVMDELGTGSIGIGPDTVAAAERLITEARLRAAS